MSSSDILYLFFFLMIRRPPRSTLDRSSAASDVYKRQAGELIDQCKITKNISKGDTLTMKNHQFEVLFNDPVSYTHLRAHETVLDLVCRLLLEKKKKHLYHTTTTYST